MSQNETPWERNHPKFLIELGDFCAKLDVYNMDFQSFSLEIVRFGNYFLDQFESYFSCKLLWIQRKATLPLCRNLFLLTIGAYLVARKFYIRRNNSNVDSIETGRIVIADLLPWSDLEKCMYITLFSLMMIKCYRHSLIYKYSFTCSLFWTTHKLKNDTKII